jgi:hypothetical protein
MQSKRNKITLPFVFQEMYRGDVSQPQATLQPNAAIVVFKSDATDFLDALGNSKVSGMHDIDHRRHDSLVHHQNRLTQILKRPVESTLPTRQPSGSCTAGRTAADSVVDEAGWSGFDMSLGIENRETRGAACPSSDSKSWPTLTVAKLVL